MGGLKSFNEILAFVAAQVGVLLLLGLYNFSFVVSNPDFIAGPIGPAGFFLVAAGILATLRLVWPILVEPVELFWGTSAKVRIGKWLLPTLFASALVFIAAAVVAFALYQIAWVNVFLFAATALALAAPFAITALLLYSAIRRREAIRGGLENMRDACSVVERTDDVERINASIATEAGSGTTTVRANPQGFTFAGLTSKPWHDPEDFLWVSGFVSAVDEILEEAESVLNIHEDRIEMYRYVGLDGEFWRSFKLAARHREVPENLELCPKTAALLKTIPGYPSFRDAMFSILDPGGLIKSHRDVSNVFLTLHLPLIAPGSGYIEVGGLRREWRKGVPLIFDSSYNHQAANKSDEARVVLLVDFLHPELTEDERAWVRASRL